MSCDCSVALPYNIMGLTAVCDCGSSWSYSPFLCIFQFCNHLDGEERAGRLTLLVFLVSCDCSQALTHGAMGWSVVTYCAILDHTRLLFRASLIFSGYFKLSYDVTSGSEITPCIKIDKPLVGDFQGSVEGGVVTKVLH